MPKRPPTARAQIGDVRHLLAAWKQISKRNVRSHGLDQVKIEDFRDQLHVQLDLISREVRSGTYRFTAARGWLAPKPGTDGKRPIKIPAVRDRVVLKAIALLIEKKFAQYNLSCSFGYIRNRGVRDAIYEVQRLASEGNKVVLEADIHKFFDEVYRSILFPSFIREVRRPSLNSLIKDALEMEVGNLDEFSDEEKQLFPAGDSGIPQGGVLSPMLANYYLYRFDKAMLDARFNLVRYADDFVVMCKDTQEAQAAYAPAKRVLEQQLHLRLHALGEKESKTRIVQFDKGLKFLGITFQAGRVAPSEAVVKKFKLRIDGILGSGQSKSLLDTLTSIRNTIVGWGQCYREFDVSQLYQELDIYIRKSTTQYLRYHRFLLHGSNVSRNQIRLLGIPELCELIPKSKSTLRPRRTSS